MGNSNQAIKPTSFTNLLIILLIGCFIFFAAFSSTTSLLYLIPTQEKTIPVTVIERSSQSGNGASLRQGGSSGLSYSITFLTSNGDKITTSSPKEAHNKALKGLNNLREMTLTLSKLANKPVALNIRSKSIEHTRILKRLIPKSEKTYNQYSLIAVPLIGALVGTALFCLLATYLILKMPKLSRLNQAIHLISYSLFAIGGAIFSV